MQHKKTFKLLILGCITVLLASCANDDDSAFTPMEFTNLSYESDYEIILGDTLKIEQEIANLPELVNFSWSTSEKEISSSQNLSFVPTEAKTFDLEFKAVSSRDSILRKYNVTVKDPFDVYLRPKTTESTALISKIIEYKPAPGQYINSTLGTLEDAEKLVGSSTNTLSLGAWGGYVIVSFDHTIMNQTDKKDFLVYGNAFKGFSEPGIVQVSFDTNGNGIADDEWFELAGSAHKNEETFTNYTTTYTNPGMEFTDVPWIDSENTVGVVKVNASHKQNYYPLFIEEQEEVSFKGTRLVTTISNSLEWGYTDNYDADYATYKGNLMELDWAVDNAGNPVNLRGIDFVKVYTGAQVNGGALGELSTEVRGIADFSMLD